MAIGSPQSSALLKSGSVFPPDIAGDRDSCQTPKPWQDREELCPTQDPALATHPHALGALSVTSPGGTRPQEKLSWGAEQEGPGSKARTDESTQNQIRARSLATNSLQNRGAGAGAFSTIKSHSALSHE